MDDLGVANRDGMEEGEIHVALASSLEDISFLSQKEGGNLHESLAILGFPLHFGEIKESEDWMQASSESKKKKKLDIGGNEVGRPSQKESRNKYIVRDVASGKQKTLDSITGLNPKKK